MRVIVSLILMLCMAVGAGAQTVTIKVQDSPAPEVLRCIVEQTGSNFIYSSEVLEGMRVTVNTTDAPLKQVLRLMFKGTGVTFKIKGNNIILTRRSVRKSSPIRPVAAHFHADTTNMLPEVVVTSRLGLPQLESAEIGALKITADHVVNTPVLLGESDVIKALQMEPGVSSGAEGMAGMHVHGGNADENMFMLDNIPLYHVNHLGGLFSAFNVDALSYVDFFKSSAPAKYDGRLSSFLDARTKDGPTDRFHSSFRLGLTSGALSIGGPVGDRTTYALAIRRSWLEVLTVPFVAVANSASHDEKTTFGYAFTDLNGKISHRFTERTNGFVSVYFGNDNLRSGSADKDESITGTYENDQARLNWGNLLVRAGVNHRFRPTLTAEFAVAYTRFFSSMKHDYLARTTTSAATYESHATTDTRNTVGDWIARADFDWSPDGSNRVRFGASGTLHSFLPARTSRHYTTETSTILTRDSTRRYAAGEFNIYIEDEWRISNRLRINAGFHGSLFTIGGNTHAGFGPRFSSNYRLHPQWALKAAYTRTTQYVHQLCETYLSLPTDQWVPITGKFKPQTADMVSVAACWHSPDGVYSASVEPYFKSMHNLVDYRDEYYLRSPLESWNARLCSGSGTAKGIDFKIERTSGKLTGQVAYSLAWTNRKFAEKNGGRPFPARFDHRHTINILLNWKVSENVQINAAWTGHSGNRFTLLTQVWDTPTFGVVFAEDSPLKATINNYRLPFYHRLDLGCTVNNRHGFWTFSLYNAYCHLNTVAIRRAYDYAGRPVFQKVRLFPIIPSFSYTWQF